MRLRPFCPYLAGAALLALTSLSAQAHTFTLSLGNAASATDYYGIICSNDGGADTDHLLLDIQSNTANSPLVFAQVSKGNTALTTVDPVSGDSGTNAFSPPLRLKGGNGLYNITVGKTGAGSLTYTITVHCLDASENIHTGTDGVVYQDQ